MLTQIWTNIYTSFFTFPLSLPLKFAVCQKKCTFLQLLSGKTQNKWPVFNFSHRHNLLSVDKGCHLFSSIQQLYLVQSPKCICMETARERCIYGTLLLHHLPKLGDGQEKIPGQIRFLPELDCISLEGESQIRFRGHKFSLHHRTEVFFRLDAGGP